MATDKRRDGAPARVALPQTARLADPNTGASDRAAAAATVKASTGAVNAAPAAVHFFVPGASPRSGGDEAAYMRLRACSEAAVGCGAKRARIVRLSCRFNGRDENIAVGEQLPEEAGLVLAIFDHGRAEGYAVHTATGSAGEPLRLRRHVYSITEFN